MMILIIGNFQSEVCLMAIFKRDGVPDSAKDRIVIGFSTDIILA